MTTYRTVKLPHDMIEKINKIREGRPELGYRSHTEFIVDSIRRRIEDLEREGQ